MMENASLIWCEIEASDFKYEVLANASICEL